MGDAYFLDAVFPYGKHRGQRAIQMNCITADTIRITAERIEMKCIDLQNDLPLYSDNILSEAESMAIEAHLPTCPSCRQKLDDYKDLRSALARMERPSLDLAGLTAIRSAVAAELLQTAVAEPAFTLISDDRPWFSRWLLPYAVGSTASLLIGFAVLWGGMNAGFQSGIEEAAAAARSTSPEPVLVARNDNFVDPIDISPAEYAASRMAFAAESPSINPRGALVALTRSFVRGKAHEEEIVVVADVFSNGLARISEVVEPARNSPSIEELQKALESDPAFAPFVPAAMDNRSGRVRVVLRLQSVDVKADPSQP